MLFDIHRGAWDDELLALLDIPPSVLPTVVASSGTCAHAVLLGATVPIAGIAGDQQAALFGQACLSPGLAKNTYGTGCFLLLNTGRTAVRSRNNLLSTVAWTRDGVTSYALEGSVFIAGAVVQWLRDGLQLVRTVARRRGFGGKRARQWRRISGPGVRRTRRAALGRLCARRDIRPDAWHHRRSPRPCRARIHRVPKRRRAVGDGSRCRHQVGELRVDGGAAANNLLLQFQADVLGVPVVRPTVLETTALGAAYLAGLAVGFWRDDAEVAANWKIDRRFDPAMSRDQAQSLRAKWNKAVARSKDWAQ